MPISVYPAPAAASSVNAVAAVPGASVKQYSVTRNFSAGIYTITVSDGTNAYVEFFNATTSVLRAVTSSGTVTVSLASDCIGAIVTLVSSASASVQINQTASTLGTTEISGTLDTITTSGTYSQTGKLYVLCVGGGGGGAGSTYDVGQGGSGGSIVGRLVVTSSPTTITIGNGGTGGVGHASGTAGGTTSFGSLVVATGGAGGAQGTWYGSSSPNYWTTIKTGYTGAGGSSGNQSNASPGGGGGDAGGIGNGGAAGTAGSRNGIAATGYGGGGGAAFGAASGSATGGAGSPGVVYVLRGF